ncbi:hypothetical protein T439DRAFT_356216 [Meredithblackwellia eburnea MCA 4105]
MSSSASIHSTSRYPAPPRKSSPPIGVWKKPPTFLRSHKTSTSSPVLPTLSRLPRVESSREVGRSKSSTEDKEIGGAEKTSTFSNIFHQQEIRGHQQIIVPVAEQAKEEVLLSATATYSFPPAPPKSSGGEMARDLPPRSSSVPLSLYKPRSFSDRFDARAESPLANSPGDSELEDLMDMRQSSANSSPRRGGGKRPPPIQIPPPRTHSRQASLPLQSHTMTSNQNPPESIPLISISRRKPSLPGLTLLRVHPAPITPPKLSPTPPHVSGATQENITARTSVTSNASTASGKTITPAVIAQADRVASLRTPERASSVPVSIHIPRPSSISTIVAPPQLGHHRTTSSAEPITATREILPSQLAGPPALGPQNGLEPNSSFTNQAGRDDGRNPQLPYSPLSFPSDVGHCRASVASAFSGASHASMDVRSLPLFLSTQTVPVVPHLPPSIVTTSHSTSVETVEDVVPQRQNGQLTEPISLRHTASNDSFASSTSSSGVLSLSVYSSSTTSDSSKPMTSACSLSSSSEGESRFIAIPPGDPSASVKAPHAREMSATSAARTTLPIVNSSPQVQSTSGPATVDRLPLRFKGASTPAGPVPNVSSERVEQEILELPFPWTTIPVADAKRLCTQRELQSLVMASVRQAGEETHRLVVREFETLKSGLREREKRLGELELKHSFESSVRDQQLSRHVATLKAFNGEAGARFAGTLVDSIKKTEHVLLGQVQVANHLTKIESARYSHAQAVASLSLVRLNSALIKSKELERTSREAANQLQAERDEALQRLKVLEEKLSKFTDSNGDVVLEATPRSSLVFSPSSQKVTAKTPISLRLSDLQIDGHKFPKPPSLRPHRDRPLFMCLSSNDKVPQIPSPGSSPGSSNSSLSRSPSVTTTAPSSPEPVSSINSANAFENPRPVPRPSPPLELLANSKNDTLAPPKNRHPNWLGSALRTRTEGNGVLPANPSATVPKSPRRFRSISDPPAVDRPAGIGAMAPHRVERIEESESATLEILETLETLELSCQISGSHHRRTPSGNHNLNSIILDDVDSNFLAEMLSGER